MNIWKAHYTDEHHDLDIEIQNTEGAYEDAHPLSFRIGDTLFHGMGLEDFELAKPEKYDFTSGEFTLMKHGGRNIKYGIDTAHFYTLQRFSMDVKIPFPVICRRTETAEESYLHIRFRLRAPSPDDGRRLQYICDDGFVYKDVLEVSLFALCIGEQIYHADGKSLCFEDRLCSLYRQIKDDYSMRCCFSCQYADYSPYGNDDYGTMLCYRKHKAAYRKVHNKAMYFEYLEGLDYEVKQETSVCDAYEPRVHCGGYRGFII